MHEAASHEGSFFHIVEEVPSISAPTIGNVGPLTIATSTVTVMLITLLFVWLAIKASTSKLVPSRFQAALEMFYEAVADFIESIVGNKERARVVVPYVGALMTHPVRDITIGSIMRIYRSLKSVLEKRFGV